MLQDSERIKRYQATCAVEAPAVVLDEPIKDELVGTVYLGKYELLSVLGVGGMGVIYQGRQIFLERPVAIKMLKNNLASAKARTRFHQEAKAASALKHPGIVSILDFGVDDFDRPYMVMEHVEGCTILDLLHERLTLPLEDILPLFIEMCDALSEAHKKGIVHRDLKPGNVMIVVDEDENGDAEPHIKILDFGIAKVLDNDDSQSLTKTGDALGTPLYMSPEQVLGKNVTYLSDLYSLGCMLYTCLTGAPPFIGDGKMATMDMHLYDKPMSLYEASEGMEFPPGIEAIVMRLLEKKPENRFQSVDQLKSALLEMAAGNDMEIAPPAGGQSVSLSRKMIDQRSEYQESTGNEQRQTAFWQSDLSQKVKAARVDRFKELPHRQAPLPDDEDVSTKVEASLNRTFAIIGGIVIFLLIAGIVVAIVFMHPQSDTAKAPKETTSVAAQALATSGPTAEIPDDTADHKITQQLRTRASISSLNLQREEGLTESGMTNLRRFTNLRNLDLTSTGMKPSWTSYLVSLPLDYLKLDNNPGVDDTSLSYFTRMATIKHLSLINTGVTDRGMVYLGSRPGLENLWLGYNKRLTDAAVVNLGPATSPLRSLFLNDCAITDGAAHSLVGFKFLYSLDLSHNPGVTEKTVLELEKKYGLQFLLLAGDNIGPAGFQSLTHYKVLRVLDVSDMNLTPADLNALATMTSLTNLYVVNCHLTTYQIDKLSRALPHTVVETNARVNSRAL